jgi:hypothetical protein
MKKRQNNSMRASAVQITFISLLAVLLTLGATPARNQFERKPAGTSVTLQNPYHRAAVSESSAAAKQTNTRKSARVEFSTSYQSVGGREIAGFSARQARRAEEENLTPPAGLKPIEQEAWVAMARRQEASDGMGLASFYPARYGEPFIVQGQGVRVAVRPVSGTDAAAQIDDGQVIYRGAYPETDSVHAVSSERSEEFLFLQNECAPREFEYELSELSAGTRVELVKGEVHFTNKAGQGVKIEAPWLIEANGAWRADAVHWEVEAAHSGSGPQRLRLVVAEGLRYPVMIDPSWTETGNMRTAREAHTATLLQSGKVLVAGGYNAPDVLSSAELYDPATGLWTATDSMSTGRQYHTATLLPSGKVLVAGGYGSGLSSAELYDPASGTWTATGSMSYGRVFHTATLLASGKVLVAGGPTSTSAELYDPATGTWTATGTTGTGRYWHTATLLPSGQVLVAGGYSHGTSLSSATLYHPPSGSWSNTGSMVTARFQPIATLLSSGRVLVAGGQFFQSSAELYDPASGTWTATGSLHTGRIYNTATLLPSGQVLVVGGYNLNAGGSLSSAELYDPASGTWMVTGGMGTARQDHTATLLPSGKVLVAGGINGITSLTSAELYDPATATWTATGDMGTERDSHTATLLPNGKVLVAAGHNNSCGCSLNTAQLYDPATGVWTVTGSLGTARYLHTATLLPLGKVLVAGGYFNVSSAELYDPATGTWTATSDMGTPREYHTATLLPSGQVLVAGGQQRRRYLSSATLYDPVSGRWRPTGSMATARAQHAATLLPSGQVLVAGGSTPLSSAELYDPGLGFDPNWQPLLTTVSPLIVPGSELTASGSRFQGISEASGGNGAQNSSSNYPLIQLLSLANEQTLFLPVDAMAGWSDTSFTSTPITLMTTSSSGFPIGYALVTVFTNGIPSQSQFVLASTSTPRSAPTPRPRPTPVPRP